MSDQALRTRVTAVGARSGDRFELLTDSTNPNTHEWFLNQFACEPTTIVRAVPCQTVAGPNVRRVNSERRSQAWGSTTSDDPA